MEQGSRCNLGGVKVRPLYNGDGVALGRSPSLNKVFGYIYLWGVSLSELLKAFPQKGFLHIDPRRIFVLGLIRCP